MKKMNPNTTILMPRFMQLKSILALALILLVGYANADDKKPSGKKRSEGSSNEELVCTAADPTTTNGTICGPGVVALYAALGGGNPQSIVNKQGTAQVNVGGGGGGTGTLTIYWFQNYSDPTTNYLTTGTSMNISISTTTTFWVAVFNSLGCWSNRIAVTGYVVQPAVANAGSNQTVCNLNAVTLGASGGSGTWSVTSGPSTSTSQFSSTTNASASFTPAGGYGNYVLTWSIPNSAPCTTSTSSVTISFNAPPTNAGAGASQFGSATCGLTTVTLGALTPGGHWSTDPELPGQTGYSFGNSFSQTSTFSGIAGATYLLDWTITSGSCSTTTTTSIVFNQNPTPASAGSNQTICVTGSATLGANSPSIGTGAWSVSSGPSTSAGQFSSTTNPSATFTPAGGAGSYVLVWTTSHAPCSPSSSYVTITVNPTPTTANAGPPQTGLSTCGVTTVTLAGNSPSAGTGSWSIVSGSGGSFGNSSSPTSTFSGTAGTTYTLQWTISNAPCASSSSTTTVTFNRNPTTSVAGNNQTICSTGSFAVLAANTPSVGTGAWSVASGPSTSTSQFNNTASAGAVFTPASGAGTYVLTWTISNSPCSSSSSNVTITAVAPPTSNAGGNQTGASTCGLTTVTLAGSAPGTGNTGTWSILSGGGGSIGNTSSPTSSFTGLPNHTYGLQWAVSNGVCAPVTSTTTVTFNVNPTTSAAGSNQTICTTTSNVTLAANTPTNGTGAWSVASGPSTSASQFSSTTNPAATFTPAGGAGNYVLTWTISNSICSPSASNVTITVNALPTVANAGLAQNGAATCGLSTVNMAGNTPTVGSGMWSIVSGSGGSFGNASSPTSTFSGTPGFNYGLLWTITSAGCTPSTSSTSVLFNINPTAANAGPNQTLCNMVDSVVLAANTPTVGTGAWSVASGPSTSLSQFKNTAVANTVFKPHNNVPGVYVLTWTTTNGTCSSAANVTVTYNEAPPKPMAYSASVLVGSGSATLYSNGGDYGSNFSNRWYTGATGGTPTTGTYYNTPTITTTTSYYVSIFNSSNNCESPRVRVDAGVIPSITAPLTVTKTTVRQDGITQDNQIYTLTKKQADVTLMYVDGLGRVVQRVDKAASPGGYDIVTPVEYDANGRTSKDYLPYTKYSSVDSTGSYQPDYQIKQSMFYLSAPKVAHDGYAFATAVYEQSPLGRLLEQGTPGNAWQVGGGHSQTLAYGFNTGVNNDEGEEVHKFNADATDAGFYGPKTLIRTQSTDANGNKTIVYTDGAGRTLAKKQQLGNTINGVMVNYLETYYVYNDLGQLAYIIPPKATSVLKNTTPTAWTVSQSFFDTWCFQFTYDFRGRLVQKKTPGQAAMYIAYDNLNRPVLTQTGVTRASNQWQFVKYDVRNRPVMAGLYTDNTNTTLSAIQSLLNGLYTAGNGTYPVGSFFETRGTTLHGYTNTSFPKTNGDGSALAVQKVSYYDNYDFDNSGTDDYNYTKQTITNEGTQARAIGMATGTKTLVLGTGTWLYAYVFYDKYGRPIQTRSNNHLSTTIDNLATASYDPNTALASLTKTHHNAGGTNQTDVTRTPVYDAKGRLLKINHQINSNTVQTLAQYQYNELGQVVMKQLHNTTGTSYMQNVDYRYNIKGWLTSINNAQLANDGGTTNSDTNDYFGMELNYQSDAGNGNTLYYNGNVSSIKWKGAGAASGATDQKSYKFAYDRTDKLTGATFQKYGTSAWDRERGTLNESVQYDHAGNILGLQRHQNQHSLSGTTVTSRIQSMDSLIYSYGNGNQLSNVSDKSTITGGFADGSTGTGTEYNYDTHGNMTSDANKGISAITYNTLGKAQQITFSNGNTVVYTYDAGGNKLAMVSTVGGTATTTNYVNGYVYNTSGGTSTLNFMSSPEGRAVKNTGGNYEYQYAIADHQGNTRILFTSAAATPQTTLADFDGDSNDQSSQFQLNASKVVSSTMGVLGNVPNSAVMMNQTNAVTGISKKVFPGDKVDLSTDSYYEANSGYGTANLSNIAGLVATAFVNATGGVDLGSVKTNGVNSAFTGFFGTGANQGDGAPAAYLNYILFDQSYKVMTAGWQVIPASPFTNEQVSIPTITVTEPGYLFAYLSYEDQSNNPVYFDNFKVKIAPTNILQNNEYYPFGLQTANSWTRDNSSNNFLYNEGSELNSTTGMYDLPFRNYDAALGRFFQVDALAHTSSDMTPYHYAGNNPIGFNDPSGLMRVSPWTEEQEAEAAHGISSAWSFDATPYVADGGGGGYLAGYGADSPYSNIGRYGYGAADAYATNAAQNYASGLLTTFQYARMIGTGVTGAFINARGAVLLNNGMATGTITNSRQYLAWIKMIGSSVAPLARSSGSGGTPFAGPGIDLSTPWGTPWMAYAKAYFAAGLAECGSQVGMTDEQVTKMEADNMTILKMLNAVGGGFNGLTSGSDLNAWCAAFVNWCLAQAGIEGTGSANAGSFVGYGTQLDTPEYGAIGVIVNARGQVTHVGFYAGNNNVVGFEVRLLGGNQGDQVGYNNFPASSFTYWCLPKGYATYDRVDFGRDN